MTLFWTGWTLNLEPEEVDELVTVVKDAHTYVQSDRPALAKALDKLLDLQVRQQERLLRRELAELPTLDTP
jgi:hypothetical protein